MIATIKEKRIYEVMTRNVHTGSERWHRTRRPPVSLVEMANANPDGGKRTEIDGNVYTWYVARRVV